jgi:hypothetical protein
MDVVHAIAVGAAVLAFLFVLFWAGEAIGLAPAIQFVSVFSGAVEASSVTALAQGLPWAIGLGGLTGALVAFFSNAFQFLGGRRR